MRRTSDIPRHKIPRDTMYRIIDAAAARNIAALSFTGGEPFLYLEELTGLIRYAGKAGIPYIRTGTNGFSLADDGKGAVRERAAGIAATLADTPLRNLWISVDSAEPVVHEAMRGFSGLVRGIEKALPVFHDHGIYPSANLGINRNVGGRSTSDLAYEPGTSRSDYLARFASVYRRAFRRFYRHVLDMGFTMVNMCYPMSVDSGTGLDAVYAATSPDRVVRFAPEEKAVLFRVLGETVSEFRSKVRIFTPRASLYALEREYSGQPAVSHPCRGGIDYLFVDCADHNVYPCGYRGADNLGPLWDLDMNSLAAAPAVCKKCDWECFRDPSELMGPALSVFSAPLAQALRWARDPRLLRLWIGDLAYYRACGWFNGRKPPEYKRMAWHRKEPGGGEMPGKDASSIMRELA